jgi:ectoine hydrolase
MAFWWGRTLKSPQASVRRLSYGTLRAMLATGTPPQIAKDEYAHRVAVAIEGSQRLGLDGLLVWGRGGGTLERYANLFYLTNHYTSFPTIPDVPGRWTGRGFGAAVLTERETILVVDIPDVVLDDVYGTRVQYAEDLVETVATVMRQLGLGAAKVGLVGSDVMTVTQFQSLSGILPQLTLAHADSLVEDQRIVKSDAEQSIIIAAGEAGTRAVTAIMETVAPGLVESEIVSAGARTAVSEGVAIYNMFATTYSPRSSRRDPFPPYSSYRALNEGDIFTVDMSGALHGYLFDMSRSRVVAAEPTTEQRALLELAAEVVMSIIDGLVPGATIGSAVARGIEVLDIARHDRGHEEFPAFGHGLGLGFERPWLVERDETTITPGMYLAVEKVLRKGPLGAAFENDVLITPSGPQLTTPVKRRWWS